MSVRVISEKPVKTKKVVCSKCGYELEYTGEDVKVGSSTCMGELDTWSYIVCPRESCKEHVLVKGW